MMTAFIRRVGILTLMTCLSCFGNVSAQMKASLWVSPVPVQTDKVLRYESATTVRSKVACLRWCRTHWNCVTIAYVVSSKMCYLHPVFDTSSSATPGDVLVYSDSDPVCKMEDVPSLNGADVTTLHRTLTSLEGDVTCKADFLHVGKDTSTVRCLATGQWEDNNSCKQRIWRNDSISTDDRLHLPDTPSAGWSASFLGVPSDGIQFSINFQDSAGNIVLHLNPRFDYHGFRRVTILSSRQEGEWAHLKDLNDPDPTFPFAKGQQFNLKVTATGSHTLELYVDGNLYADVILRDDINTITNVDMRDGVTMTFVDLWTPVKSNP